MPRLNYISNEFLLNAVKNDTLKSILWDDIDEDLKDRTQMTKSDADTLDRKLDLVNDEIRIWNMLMTSRVLHQKFDLQHLVHDEIRPKSIVRDVDLRSLIGTNVPLSRESEVLNSITENRSDNSVKRSIKSLRKDSPDSSINMKQPLSSELSPVPIKSRQKSIIEILKANRVVSRAPFILVQEPRGAANYATGKEATDSTNNDKFDVNSTMTVSEKSNYSMHLRALSPLRCHFIHFTKRDIHWGGIATTVPTIHMKRTQSIKSIDVVEDLFHMSNELREEREHILHRHPADEDDCGMQAYIHRDVTLKYNEELEDIKKVL